MPEIQWHIGGTGSSVHQFFVADVSIANVIAGPVKTEPDIYLVLGGDGPLRDDLVALAKRLGVALIIENYQNVKENPENWREISHECGKFAESNCS